jgi:hypothetical protein
LLSEIQSSRVPLSNACYGKRWSKPSIFLGYEPKLLQLPSNEPTRNFRKSQHLPYGSVNPNSDLLENVHDTTLSSLSTA